jgi:hypothetical protein
MLKLFGIMPWWSDGSTVYVAFSTVEPETRLNSLVFLEATPKRVESVADLIARHPASDRADACEGDANVIVIDGKWSALRMTIDETSVLVVPDLQLEIHASEPLSLQDLSLRQVE